MHSWSRTNCAGWWARSNDSLFTAAQEAILAPLKEELGGEGPRKVDIGGGVEINTLTAGQGPPLVLLHGMAAGLGLWPHNLPALIRDNTVHAIDVIGFAGSDRPEPESAGSALTPEEAEEYFLSHTLKWADTMGLERFVLMGHSMGGFLAGKFALRHPERVSHLILADPWGVPPRDDTTIRTRGVLIRTLATVLSKFNPLAAMRAAGPVGHGLVKKVRGDIAEKYSGILEDTDVVVDYIYHCNAVSPTGETAFSALMEGLGWAANPLGKSIGELDPSIPVSIFYGSHSWMTKSAGQKMAEDLGSERSTFYIVPNAGHHIYADNAEFFNSKVLNELKKWREAPPRGRKQKGPGETPGDSGGMETEGIELNLS